MSIIAAMTSFFSGLLMAVQGAAAQGVLWGIMTLGVYITFKVLDFPDMTVDGSFALGGAVSATLIVRGMDPFLTLLFAMAAGMAAGIVTGLLHTKLKIPGILAGILTMIALYSINIRIIGAANIPLLGERTVITTLEEVLPLSKNWIALILGGAIAALVIGALYWFFGTEIGCAIRATGSNEYMVRALGASTDNMKMAGLMLSNGLASLSGALVAQSQGYGDVGMGTGTIVIGLASIIIGEVIFGKRFNFAYKLASVVLGSILYRIIIAMVLQAGMKSTDLKLLTAIIVAIALSIPVIKRNPTLRGYALILLWGVVGYLVVQGGLWLLGMANPDLAANLLPLAAPLAAGATALAVGVRYWKERQAIRAILGLGGSAKC